MTLPGEKSLAAPARLDELRWLQRYAAIGLLVVGGIEWFLGRTVSRVAAAPTLEGLPRTIIETLGRTGQAMLSPAFMLVVLVYMLCVLGAGAAFVRRRDAWGTAVAMLLGLLGLLAAVSLFVPPLTWFNIVLNVIAALAVWLLAVQAFRGRVAGAWQRMLATLVALAYSGWFYYVLQGDLGNSGLDTPGAALLMLNLGEIAAVCAPFAFFLAVALPGGEWRHARRWIVPVIVVVLFAAANVADAIFDQGFTGVFAIWSVGLDLFLPWPLYAASLALFVYGVLTCFSRAREASADVGLAMLLLLFAGYNLQLSYQLLLAVVSMMLICGLARPLAGEGNAGDAASSYAAVK